LAAESKAGNNMNELIKKLELLSESCKSEHALYENGFERGVQSAIEVVKAHGISDSLPAATVGYTFDGAIIYAEDNPAYIPKKGETVHFQNVETKLKDFQKEWIFEVAEVAYSLTSSVMILIYKL